jgi:hypothetical protein
MEIEPPRNEGGSKVILGDGPLIDRIKSSQRREVSATSTDPLSRAPLMPRDMPCACGDNRA